MVRRYLTRMTVLATLLAACGGGGAETTVSQPVETQPAGSAAPATTTGGEEKVTLRFLGMDQAAYGAASVQEMIDRFQAEHPNIEVETTLVAFEALHDKITVDQASGTGEYDVVLVDEIWPSEFAAAGFIQEVTDRITEEQKAGIIPEVAAIMQVGDAVYGVPWILDSKYLFYNADMLAQAGFDAPPATLEELVTQAQAIKDAGIVDYPMVWSWGQAEAAIVDYSAIVYAFGGELLDASGASQQNQTAAVEAVEWMKSTIDSGLTNPNSTSFLEEDVRQVFSQGEAAFALNWTYMFALANDPAESTVAGQVGIAPMPAGPAGPAGPSGSMGMAITAGSKHPDEAWELISFLTSFDVQKDYAAESLPIWQEAFDNPETLNAPLELVEVAGAQFPTLKARPGFVTWYNQWSIASQAALQEILLGLAPAQERLDALADEVAGLAG